MQHPALVLNRENISATVVVALRDMIVDGRLSPGERINEVHLARQLGVSRTPLREALVRLAHEGALRIAPRIGYFVQSLTLDEFEQIYAIRQLLDPEALRLAGVPSRERLERLVEINDAMSLAGDAESVIALDDEFHLELVAGCPNTVLLDLIRQFSHRTRCYELALMRERSNVQSSVADHARLLKALRKGDIEAAYVFLKQNMLSGRGPIIQWLTERAGYRPSVRKGS